MWWNLKKIKILVISSIIIILLVPVSFVIYYKFVSKSIKLKSSVILTDDIEADSIVVFKSERRLVLMENGKTLKEYHISLGDEPVGHKEQEGDEKTPEGLYKIDYRITNTKYHYSLHISYPNSDDILHAAGLGVSPGGDITIHGCPENMSYLEDYYINNDWTDGCIALSNNDIKEVAGAVPDGTPIFINP